MEWLLLHFSVSVVDCWSPGQPRTKPKLNHFTNIIPWEWIQPFSTAHQDQGWCEQTTYYDTTQMKMKFILFGTITPAVAMNTTAVAEPEDDIFPDKGGCLDEARVQEQSWVEHALPFLETEELTSGVSIAWAANYSPIQPPVEDLPALCALLRMFYEKSATPAMISAK